MKPGERLAKLLTKRTSGFVAHNEAAEPYATDTTTPRDELQNMLDDCLRACTTAGAQFTASDLAMLARVRAKLSGVVRSPLYAIEVAAVRVCWDRLAQQTVDALMPQHPYGTCAQCGVHTIKMSRTGYVCEDCARGL